MAIIGELMPETPERRLRLAQTASLDATLRKMETREIYSPTRGMDYSISEAKFPAAYSSTVAGMPDDALYRPESATLTDMFLSGYFTSTTGLPQFMKPDMTIPGAYAPMKPSEHFGYEQQSATDKMYR